MADNATPALPEPDLPGEGDPTPDRVPDPHRGEALPPEMAGMDPDADASQVRPVQDEPGGPLPGLVKAASAEVEAEVTDDPSAEALLAQMGVEDEGIESGQLVGMMLAVLVGVAALAFALIFLFIIPDQQRTAEEAEINTEYPELESVTAAGLAQLNDYRTVDGGYGIPIERAMDVIAAEYDSTARSTQAATRQEFNTSWIDLKPDGAVRTAGGRETLAASEAPIAEQGAEALPAVTDEAVGVDDPDDVEAIE